MHHAPFVHLHVHSAYSLLKGSIKIAKLGNPQTNWIPGPEQERRFSELVAQAEMDPHAWIVYHYGVQLDAEAWDRLITWIDLNAPCHGTWREVTRLPGNQRERRE